MSEMPIIHTFILPACFFLFTVVGIPIILLNLPGIPAPMRAVMLDSSAMMSVMLIFMSSTVFGVALIGYTLSLLYSWIV